MRAELGVSFASTSFGSTTMMDMRVRAASATNEPLTAARTAAAPAEPPRAMPHSPKRAALSDAAAVARKRGTHST